MKYAVRSYSVILIALAVLLSWECAATKTTGLGNKEGAIEANREIGGLNYTAARMDASLSSAIKIKFATDEMLSTSDINVDTTNGIVTLNGKVDTQAEEDRAMQLGRSVNGVRSVRSNLAVKSTTK